jgi:ribosomal protein L33
MRLIDADTLKERAIKVSTVKEHVYMKAVGTKEIDKAPTIDPKDLSPKGKWINKGRKLECSVCHHRIYLGTDDEDLQKFEKSVRKYCSWCGAEMDGE